ncbi:uncharacterized protein LOC111285408 [Durio zibethinus]|uniref:Uncharacterized protein LOC111285408 n=1 Tax=Durio zibethinus TaxID=66656 RepID=A0A6P5XQV9_DURZI|nr:uncharacterized protein LOC111285408 [Durio zibethinus]
MFLRSSSTPILKTTINQSSAGADAAHRIPSKPISLTASPINKIQRTWSDGNMRDTVIPKKQKLPVSLMASPYSVKEEETDTRLTSLSLAGGGYNSGGVGGRGGAESFGDWGEGKQKMDEYYQNMIKTYPGESLLLANYAKFLKEIRGDLLKAEEYCERAALMKPDDGEILSMYGDLIWNNHRDGARAQSYFDRAVLASPGDCHVLASYARYLWTAENDQEEEQEEKRKDEKKNEHQINGTKTYAPQRHGRISQGRPHLAAAY